MSLTDRNEARKAVLCAYLDARSRGASESRAYDLARDKAKAMGAGSLADRLAELARERAES